MIHKNHSSIDEQQSSIFIVEHEMMATDIKEHGIFSAFYSSFNLTFVTQIGQFFSMSSAFLFVPSHTYNNRTPL